MFGLARRIEVYFSCHNILNVGLNNFKIFIPTWIKIFSPKFRCEFYILEQSQCIEILLTNMNWSMWHSAYSPADHQVAIVVILWSFFSGVRAGEAVQTTKVFISARKGTSCQPDSPHTYSGKKPSGWNLNLWKKNLLASTIILNSPLKENVK